MTTNQSTQSHWRMQLNNLLQANPALGTLEWVDRATRGHQGPWTATVTVNGVEYGTGRGNSKQVAREAAAKIAYEELLNRLEQPAAI